MTGILKVFQILNEEPIILKRDSSINFMNFYHSVMCTQNEHGCSVDLGKEKIMQSYRELIGRKKI